MHELALCQSILSIVENEARNRQVRRVLAVRLEVGDLTCASADAMAFCFDAVTRNTIAEGATLELIRTPGEAWCLDCGRRVEIADRHQPCPQCGSLALSICSGEELRVTEVEVE
jgi:hydrogenase nickel insertion protein HypA